MRVVRMRVRVRVGVRESAAPKKPTVCGAMRFHRDVWHGAKERTRCARVCMEMKSKSIDDGVWSEVYNYVQRVGGGRRKRTRQKRSRISKGVMAERS